MQLKLILVSVVAVCLLASLSSGQLHLGSQILAAYYADIIFVGEVLELEDASFGGQYWSQVMKLKKIEVIKGRLNTESVSLRIGFGERANGVVAKDVGEGYELSRSRFGPGNRFIVIFHIKLGPCEPSYGGVNGSCYAFTTNDLIPYSNDELEAMRSLVSSTHKRD